MLQIKQKNAGSRPEWLVSKRYTFGSGADNNYKVSGEGVNALQAALEVNGDDVMLFNLGGGDTVKLNGEVVERRHPVKANDHFYVGDAHFLVEDPKQKRAEKLKNAPPKQKLGWRLKAKNTALANRSFDLAGEMTIGRSNDCDICLNVVHLSRKHARVTAGKAELRIDDLNSSNGTYVNGNKIESAIVKPGDELRFDTLEFLVLGPDDEANKTRMRAAEDNDATTLRPAIGASSHAPRPKPTTKPAAASAKAKANRAKVLPASAAQVNSPKKAEADDWDTTKNSGSSSFTVAIVIILAAAAGAAYWFLGR